MGYKIVQIVSFFVISNLLKQFTIDSPTQDELTSSSLRANPEIAKGMLALPPKAYHMKLTPRPSQIHRSYSNQAWAPLTPVCLFIMSPAERFLNFSPNLFSLSTTALLKVNFRSQSRVPDPFLQTLPSTLHRPLGSSQLKYLIKRSNPLWWLYKA